MDPLSLTSQVPSKKYVGPSPLEDSKITFKNKDDKNEWNVSTLDFDPKFVDVVLYNKYLESIEKVLQIPEIGKYTDLIYPYDRIGKGPYVNRCAHKLANLDYHFNLLPSIEYGDLPRTDILHICDLAGGPGGFSQYVLSQFPNATSFGITLRRAIDWDGKMKNYPKFSTFYGPDLTGDMLKWYQEYSVEAFKRAPEGCHLVVSDAGFEESDRSNKEKRLYSLLLVESYLGMYLTKDGGHFITKVYNIVSPATIDLLYLLSQHFTSISIFKPVLSRNFNLEAYVICRGRNNKRDDLPRINDAIQMHLKDPTVGITFDSINPLFYGFIKEWNNRFYTNHLDLNNTTFKIYESKGTYRDHNTPIIDLHRLLITLKMKE